MAVATLKYITEAEYLALEEKSEVKHEYYAGQIYAMSGGTEDHSLIAANAGGEIRQAAKGLPAASTNRTFGFASMRPG